MERIRYQNELIQSEERFKKLNAASREGVVIHDNGIVLECNDAFCEIFKMSPKKAKGTNIFDYTHPDSKKSLIENVKNKIEKRTEIKGIRTDGQAVLLEIQASEIIHNKKSCRVVTVRDITEQRKIQEELKNKEQLFRVLANNASDIVFRYSFVPEYKLDYISPSIETITGYPVDKFYKDPFFGYSIVHQEDRQKTEKGS